MTIRALLLSAVLILFMSGSAGAQALKYEPAVVRLSGTLVSGQALTPNDEKVSFPAIKLDKPVRVEKDPKADIKDDPNAVTEDNVSRVQLILSSDAQMKQYTSLKGKHVVVTGTLMHQITGHHYTNVLITVQKIERR